MKLSVPQVKFVRKLLSQNINVKERGKLAFEDGTEVAKPCFLEKLSKRSLVALSECEKVWTITESGRKQFATV